MKKFQLVTPLVIINLAAIYGQVSFAYDSIAPGEWSMWAKICLAIGVASAIESVSLYVSFHALDALLLRSFGTSAKLRRTSYLIALIVGLMNYSHFTTSMLKPTAAGLTFGMLSLVSPWLWGLHARRERHVQLLNEDSRLIDEAGVEFSPERWKAFPIRSFMARRYALDEYITEPKEAWQLYKSHKSVGQQLRKGVADLTDDDWEMLSDSNNAPISPVPSVQSDAIESLDTMMKRLSTQLATQGTTAGKIRLVARELGTDDLTIVSAALKQIDVTATPSRIRNTLATGSR
jgi:hypothetical protein